MKNLNTKIENDSFEKIKQNLISINFISQDESIFYSIICKNTEKFLKIEELLYDAFPELDEIELEFFINGAKIRRNKTLLDNKIKDNSIIIIKQNI